MDYYSEEIFDFSRDQMTSEKAKRLKASLNQEFTQIFQVGGVKNELRCRGSPCESDRCM